MKKNKRFYIISRISSKITECKVKGSTVDQSSRRKYVKFTRRLMANLNDNPVKFEAPEFARGSEFIEESSMSNCGYVFFSVIDAITEIKRHAHECIERCKDRPGASPFKHLRVAEKCAIELKKEFKKERSLIKRRLVDEQ